MSGDKLESCKYHSFTENPSEGGGEEIMQQDRNNCASIFLNSTHSFVNLLNSIVDIGRFCIDGFDMLILLLRYASHSTIYQNHYNCS